MAVTFTLLIVFSTFSPPEQNPVTAAGAGGLHRPGMLARAECVLARKAGGREQGGCG